MNMTQVQQGICPECQNYSKCPGCGRMTYSENKSNIQTMSQNCENMVNVNQTQNNMQTENEQNIAMKQEECICPDCQKCSGCGNIQTMSQNVEVNVNQTQNMQNVHVEENEQHEQNVAVQQDECICPDCKQTEVVTD